VLKEPARFERQQWLSRLAYEPDDPPNIWALKVRVLSAAGFTSEAKRLLVEVPAHCLAGLPCDRDYLGTLGSLTRAALTLDARRYLEALEPLLAPYADKFATNIAFFCEGPLLHMQALIATRFGRHKEAREQLTAAEALSQRAGLGACAAEARLELALRRSQAS
jgi:hypothetical protein